VVIGLAADKVFDIGHEGERPVVSLLGDDVLANPITSGAKLQARQALGQDVALWVGRGQL
jgi:hypothetical protein